MPEADGLAAQLMQLVTPVRGVLDRLRPLIDQPVIRQPYTMETSQTAIIPPGANNLPLPAADFQHSLEYPFEIHYMKVSQDPSHTFRDWQLDITDQTFNTQWFKNPQMIATLVKDNTGAWDLDFPWTVRPKGGALLLRVTNLDGFNPIGVDVGFVGYLLIPRAGAAYDPRRG